MNYNQVIRCHPTNSTNEGYIINDQIFYTVLSLMFFVKVAFANGKLFMFESTQPAFLTILSKRICSVSMVKGR
jgi:hypothetical protein